MTDHDAIRARVQKLVDRSPHNSWLGLKITSLTDDGIEVTSGWREDFISAPERRAVHGGVLAALVDSASIFAVMARSLKYATTVDLRVDYHAIAASDCMRVTGRVIRLGKTISTAEAAVHDINGKLVASGRATIMTLPQDVP